MLDASGKFQSKSNLATIQHGIACFALFVSLAGCRTEHDDHEEESHFPPHWPSSFLVATERLQQIANDPSGTKTEAESLEQELADLVDWLPELIADSDVRKADFDKVDSWAFPLASEFKKQLQGGAEVEDLVKNERFRKGLAGLVELAAQTRIRMEEEKAIEERDAAEANQQAEEMSPPIAPDPGGEQ